MKGLLRILLLLMAISTWLYAGADGTAVIIGKSASGRTQLELHTSDIDRGVKYFKLTIDGKSYEVGGRKDSETYSYIVYDRKNQVFTVVVDNIQIDFKFWAVPSSLKVLQQDGGSARWEFRAFIEATDPRGFTAQTRNLPMAPRIALNCTLNYQL